MFSITRSKNGMKVDEREGGREGRGEEEEQDRERGYDSTVLARFKHRGAGGGGGATEKQPNSKGGQFLLNNKNEVLFLREDRNSK